MRRAALFAAALLAPPLAVHAAARASPVRAAEPPVVVVDPGHDALANPRTEPIGPGSATRKVMDGGGTRGRLTGTPEAVVTLAVSRRLAARLRAAGVRVVLTRTVTAGVSAGNVARAQVANRNRAALFIRVHADGATDATVRGTHTLHPASIPGWTDDVAAASRRAARLVQQELVRALRLPDRGLQERRDITGFNWADVPAVLPELGFLTNVADERVLTSAGGQTRAALGLCRATLRFLGRDPGGCER